jgi:signal transduction histidine kinase
MRRRLSAGTIAGVGIATAVLTLWFIATSQATSGLVFVADVIVPLLFSAFLVGASYWAWADRSADSAMVRLSLWCLAGAGVVGGFEFLTLYSQFDMGVALQKELQTLNAGVARGGVIGIAFGFYDVERRRTERREQQLERQVDRLEEFASIVSHDLRSPLTVARGHMELMQATHDLDEEHVSQIEFAHERMTEIIEDSLALARGGHTVDETEPVDIESVARTAWKTVDPSAAALRLQGSGSIDADEDRLKRLLENLFRNSVEHGLPAEDSSETVDRDASESASESELTVTIGLLTGENGFFVEDDGVGIPLDDGETMFEAGETGSGSGSGLGLAIVRRIAQAHGWRVDLTESDTGGARFEFRGT